MKIMNILQPIIGPGQDNVLFYEMLLPRESVPGGDVQAYFNECEYSGEIKEHNLNQIKHVLKLLDTFPDKVAVNLSMQTLDDEAYREQIFEAIKSSAPEVRGNLILEITEKHRPEYDMDAIGKSIRALRAEGCDIAIDDLGLGADPREVFIPDVDCLKLEHPVWHSAPMSMMKHWIKANQAEGRKVILEGVRPDELLHAWALGADGAQILKGTLAVSQDWNIGPYTYPKPRAIGKIQLEP